MFGIRNKWTVRQLQKLLVRTSLIGSMVFGAQGLLVWLFVPPLALLVNLYAEDRAVRARIGEAPWASQGYARFLFGTNLFILVWTTALCLSVFGLAGMFARALLPALA